jgi:hypothetical protein
LEEAWEAERGVILGRFGGEEEAKKMKLVALVVAKAVVAVVVAACEQWEAHGYNDWFGRLL